MSFEQFKSTTAELIAEAKQGRMFVLVDDEDRENEGDLVIPAQMATPETINFMAKHGRGLICLAMERERVEQLGLPLMSLRNGTRHQTAFTISIEARDGISTGISAFDRARTIQVAIDPSKGAGDIVTPGHVFPLVARDGGVLVRTGHTEAAVDVARLAGLTPAGVICEVLNEDGSMARRDDLVQFAQFHGLKIGTIADLIAYRRRYDRIVERTLETTFESRFGGPFKLYVYTNTVAHAEHVALVKGDLHTEDPVLVRFLRWLPEHATRRWLILDLHRHWMSWTAVWAGTRLMRMHPMVSHDGPVSVNRAFKRDDWIRLLAEAGVDAEIRWVLPFRWAVSGQGG